jgi:cell wall-associated NlpC family hydrolase
MASIPGLPLAFIAVGGVLVWSGIENEPVTDIFRSLATGKAPTKGPAETFATAATASTTGTLPASSSAIANDAMTYVGHPYSFGGYYDDPSGWDCSSFVNWVLGHDFGMTLPGGVKGYNGQSHGPIVAMYVLWSGAENISKSQVAAGDLILYPPDTHMGIAVSNTEFVSAEDPANGTAVAPMSDGPGPWIARRIITGNP